MPVVIVTGGIRNGLLNTLGAWCHFPQQLGDALTILFVAILEQWNNGFHRIRGSWSKQFKRQYDPHDHTGVAVGQSFLEIRDGHFWSLSCYRSQIVSTTPANALVFVKHALTELNSGVVILNSPNQVRQLIDDCRTKMRHHAHRPLPQDGLILMIQFDQFRQVRGGVRLTIDKSHGQFPLIGVRLCYSIEPFGRQLLFR